MAPTTTGWQHTIKAGVLAFFAHRIANALYQWDKRDAAAQLDAQDPLVQDKYDRLATVIALQNDERVMRAALYAGADALVAPGLDSLTPKQRGQAVLLFIRGLKAMRAHLASTSNPDHRDLMQALVDADKASGIEQQPLPTMATEPPDLSALRAHPEVM